MADHLNNEVSLGHLGRATYIEELQEWRFSRAPNQGFVFKLAGEANIISHGTNLGPSREPRNTNTVTKRTEQMLLNLYPELTHGLSNMVLEEATSRAITRASSRFESSSHECLAFGEIEHMADDRIACQTIPIMVFSTGGQSSSLVLCPCDSSRNALFPSAASKIDDDQSVWWNLPGGPVKQVLSSESIQEPNKCFAARLSYSTTIFSPIYHRNPVPVNLNDNDSYAEPCLLSHIDPNPLVNIPCGLTGGYPHAAVTFNPWYQRQIAVIDRAGNWSVWDLQRRQQRKAGWYAERGPNGSIRLPECEKSSKPIDPYDSWGAILWVCTIHQLLVCDRRNVYICRMDVRPPEQEELSLGLEIHSEWILDAIRSPKTPSHVFILTTLRIIWVHVPPPDNSNLSQSDNAHAASILLSWRHFRDPEDISLRLTPISMETDLFIMLHSRLNLLATTVQVLSSDDPSYPVSICDTRILHLPKIKSEHAACGMKTSHNTVNFSSISFQDNRNPDSSLDDNSTESPKSVTLIGQLMDGRLVECIYLATVPNQEILPDIIPISVGRKKRPAKRHAKLTDESDFVVQDEESSLLIPMCLPDKPTKHGLSMAALPTYETREQWQQQYSLATSILEHMEITNLTESGNTTSFGDWLNALKGQIAELIPALTSCSTSLLMSEAVPSSFSVDEAENIAKAFDQFVLGFADPADCMLPEFQLHILLQPSTPTSKFSMIKPNTWNNHSLMELYDTMICLWLAPLPDGIPNRLRALKEQTIRKVISELCIASIILSRCRAEEANDDQEAGSSSLVKPEAHSVSEFKGQLTQWSGDDVSSSPPRTRDLNDNQTRPMLASLARYTVIHCQRPISQKTITTAAHWVNGSDPNRYDWQATVSLYDNSQSENDNNFKRRKRKERRPSSSTAQSQRSVSADIPITRPWGSQPETNAFSSGIGSSQVSEGGLTMTQGDQGVFGRRKPLLKSKKKKRMAGF
ncbi:RNA polymerase I-specific transcription-initiation factor [Trichophyton interdigitale]|uniref:RNA polymerase I-specific transcription-initiation factor n=1 Tax=Trichophyton interdigitale TaxID=101480 RepID=A0A9P4YFE4_9EURO|nr:RNA polymerase I-specific transcription-initiation factor [Trichophyton interdigitale]KAF3895986.1 RNA polymerase I-specific transcription-initiation factor [Trichophyton interdigitale]KAG8207610.1 RNA polymerase I-specific transcription-initiation factor [Trichophyton interdigitale]